MFFLIITTNLALFLSSFQLISVGSGLAGGLVLTGGIVTTALSALFYQFRNQHAHQHGHHHEHHHAHHEGTSKKLKKIGKLKKLIPDCDCLPDCDCDCCGCD